MKARNALAKLLALGLALVLAGCSSAPAETTSSSQADSAPASSAVSPASSRPEDSESTTGEELTGEVVVFAAASLTETLTELQASFQEDHPGVEITFNFDSSGTLKTQIEEGAACDLFLSAGQKQMDQLDSAADPAVNTDGLDFVDSATRLDLLENKLTLCVPEDNPKGIDSFDSLAEALTGGDILFCMGNSDVPVGQYTQGILEYYGLDEEALAQAGTITYGTNVKEVTTQVKEGSVDAGVVYCTDAYSAGLTVVDTATEDMCGQVIYPAAVLKTAENPQAAQAFLDYLTGEEAMAVFAEVGFSPAP